MSSWIEKQEATGQSTLPNCPFCRHLMTPDDIVIILGRPFTPCESIEGMTPNNEELDELTLQFLNEHTQPCPACGARIEKIEGGCDLMECMCGFRFCYRCGSQGAECSCTPDHHSFWDNVVDRAASPEAGPVASVDEATGQVNLLAHILKRKRKEEGRRKQRKRRAMRRTAHKECQFLDEFTSSAKWLFCPVERAGLRMLDQYYRGLATTLERQEDSYWSRIREDDEREKTAALTGMVLESFLFLPKAGSKFFVNYQHALSHKRLRDVQKWEKSHELREHDKVAKTGFSMETFLFLPNENAFLSILAKQESAEEIACFRRGSYDEDDDDDLLIGPLEPSNLDMLLMNGAILFEDSDYSKTCERLNLWFERQAARDDAIISRRFEGEFLSFRCCCGDCVKCRRRQTESEKWNVLQIRQLFLPTDEKKDLEMEAIEFDWVE